MLLASVLKAMSLFLVIEGDDVCIVGNCFWGLNGNNGSATNTDDHGNKRGGAPKTPSKASKKTQSPPKKALRDPSKGKQKRPPSKSNKEEEAASSQDYPEYHDFYDGLDVRPCLYAYQGMACAHKGYRGKFCFAQKKSPYTRVDAPDEDAEDNKDETPILLTNEELLRAVINMTFKPVMNTPEFISWLHNEIVDCRQTQRLMMLLHVRESLAGRGLYPKCCSETCSEQCETRGIISVKTLDEFRALSYCITSINARYLTNVRQEWWAHVSAELTERISNFPMTDDQDLTQGELQSFTALCHRRSVCRRYMGLPCCEYDCRSDRACRFSFETLSKREQRRSQKAKFSLEESTLNGEELNLDVKVGNSVLWPLLLAILSAFIASYLNCWSCEYRIVLVGLAIGFSVVGQTTTWYSVRHRGRMREEHQVILEEAYRNPLNKNTLSNQQEKEEFVKPELRFVDIDSHTYISEWWMRDDTDLSSWDRTRVPALLSFIESRPLFVTSTMLLMSLIDLIPYEWTLLWICSLFVVVRQVRDRSKKHLICLNALSGFTSHMVLRHGQTLLDFSVSCATYVRTLSKIVLPPRLNYLIKNNDCIINMTNDVAVLIFQHRKNVEADLPYLKGLAPRYAGSLLVWLDMATSFFQPLLLGLAPLVQFLFAVGLPLRTLLALTQMIFPNVITLFILHAVICISMVLLIRTHISEELIAACLARSIGFVEGSLLLMSHLYGVLDDFPVDLRESIFARFIRTSWTSILGLWLRIIRWFSVRCLRRYTNYSVLDTTGESSTSLDPNMLDQFPLSNSSTESTDARLMSVYSRNTLDEDSTRSDSEI